MIESPPRWRTKPLAELCDVVIGRTPSRANPLYWGDGHRWLSIADMKDRNLLTTSETITDAAISDCGCRPVTPGTVVISFKLSVGKVGIVRAPMFTNEAIAALPILQPECLDATFLFYALQVADLGVTDRAAKGLTLNKPKLEKIRIPLPSLAEQKRIAAILDKADAIRRRRQEAARLAAELPRVLFMEWFGHPRSPDTKWPRRLLGDLCSRLTVGFVGPMASEYITTGVPMLRSLNVRRGEIVGGDLKYISREFHEALAKSALRPGDVVSVRTGQPGTTAVIPEEIVEANCADLIVMTCGPDIEPVYLCELLNLRLGDHEALEGTTGAIQTHFNIGRARELPIPLPPKPRQTAYAKACEECAAVRDRARAAVASADTLFNALVQRAFRGEL